MQTKICFRNILRCEGKCLSLKAGVLKAGIYLKKTFFFLKKKKIIELKAILPPKECRFKLPSQIFVFLGGCGPVGKAERTDLKQKMCICYTYTISFFHPN